jgi:hypothetical protein
VAHLIVIRVLEAELNAGDVAGVERLAQASGKRRRLEGRRRDEIEPGAEPGGQLRPL